VADEDRLGVELLEFRLGFALAKSSPATKSSASLPFVARSVDFGLVATRRSGTGCKYVPRSPAGLRPAFLNSPAM
jgi:hypothetical protein